MSANQATISEGERIRRQEAVENAIASVRLEGLEPTAAALSVFDRYVAGDITVDEMGAEIRALNARESRPIPVPGD